MVKTPVIYERIVQFRSKYLAGQEIPSVAALIYEIEERQLVLGDSAEQATKAVVEELERAAAAINVRTAPLVPTCGLVVAGAGLLERFTTPTPLLLEAVMNSGENPIKMRITRLARFPVDSQFSALVSHS